MSENDKQKRASEFEVHGHKGRNSLATEFWGFLKHNKKWWLLPIIIVLLIMGLIVLLSGTAIAPFIYPLF